MLGSDYQVVTYTKWHGTPRERVSEGCVMIVTNAHRGKWDDKTRSLHDLGFICEYRSKYPDAAAREQALTSEVEG